MPLFNPSAGGTDTKAILAAGNSTGTAISAPATTNYLAFNFTGGIAGSGSTFNATEANRQTISPVAGTLKNLYVRTNNAQAADDSLVFTVRINGVSTGITITVAADAAAGTFSDTTHTAVLAAGDLISLEVTNNSPSLTGAAVTHWAILIQ